jgi:hypothetical protein
VPRFAGDPLPAGGKVQRLRRVLVMAEGAGDGHEAVADEAVPEAAGLFRGAGGDGVAGDALRQWNRASRVGLPGEAVAALPVLIHEVPVAKIGHAGAADLAEAPEGGGIGRLAEHDVDPGAKPLERRAVVGRSEKDELLELAAPGMLGFFAVFAGAARDEAAHAVADDDEVLDFDGPGGDERLQRLGEGAAVHRDVEAGIVGEIDGRVAEVMGERRAMVVVLARPLQVAHAKSMHEHGELAGRVGKGLGDRTLVELQGPSLAAKSHRQRQRIAGLGEVVADDAVERGERDRPPARRRRVVGASAEQRRCAADALGREPEGAADAAIDEPRDPASHGLRERGQSRRVENGIMHLLDEAGDPGGAVGGETAEAEHIRERKGGGPGRHGGLLRVGGDGPHGTGLILSGLRGVRPAAHAATRASARIPAN